MLFQDNPQETSSPEAPRSSGPEGTQANTTDAAASSSGAGASRSTSPGPSSNTIRRRGGWGKYVALGVLGLAVASYTIGGYFPVPGLSTPPPPDIFAVNAGPEVPTVSRQGLAHCVNAQHGYRFDFPAGWVLHQPTQYTEKRARVLLNPTIESAGIVVLPFQLASTNEKDEIGKTEQTYLGQPNLASSEEAIQVNDLRGYQRSYSLQVNTSQGPMDFKVIGAYLFKEKACMAVYLKAADEDFDKVRPALTTVINSLRIEKMNVGSSVQARKSVQIKPGPGPSAGAPGVVKAPGPSNAPGSASGTAPGPGTTSGSAASSSGAPQAPASPSGSPVGSGVKAGSAGAPSQGKSELAAPSATSSGKPAATPPSSPAASPAQASATPGTSSGPTATSTKKP